VSSRTHVFEYGTAPSGRAGRYVEYSYFRLDGRFTEAITTGLLARAGQHNVRTRTFAIVLPFATAGAHRPPEDDDRAERWILERQRRKGDNVLCGHRHSHHPKATVFDRHPADAPENLGVALPPRV
jgi:hypothetical protein